MELLRTLRRFDAEALAYCVLPTHAHLLIAGLGPRADPRAGLRRWKQLTGYTHRARTGQGLWRQKSAEYVLTAEDIATLGAAAAYLVAAPVRARLARRADQYRWVGVTRWPLSALARIRRPRAPDWWPEGVIAECRTGYSPPR